MRVARSPYMHSEVNSVYVPYLEVFSKLRNLQKFRSWSRAGCREWWQQSTECRVEEDAEAKLRRNERGEAGGKGGEELGEDAFILPTGNYPPNNTCISSTPVAHRLSSKGTSGEGLSSKRAKPEGWRGWAKEEERYNKLRGHERRNNGIIVESMDYVIHRRGKAKSHSYTFFDIAFVLLAVSRYTRPQSPSSSPLLSSPLLSSPLARIFPTRAISMTQP